MSKGLKAKIVSSPDDMNPFDQARVEWKSLSADRGYYGIFGELYIQRYPFLAGMTTGSAASIKRSLAGDDSVHAFDASGIRQTIISRALETEGRGEIRPWYAHIGFIADATNFIKGIKEDEIDFLIRRCHLDHDGESITGVHADLRKELTAEIDPPLDRIRTTQGTINQFELEKLASGVIVPAARPAVELFGFLSALTNHLFTISPDEIEAVIDILLDPEKTDKFLRRRFIGEETGDYPFIGEQHPRIRTHENMILDTISKGDPDYYQLRVVHFWLYALLRDDRYAQEHFYSRNASFLEDLKSWREEDSENRHYSQLIQRAVVYAKFKSVYSRVLLTLRTDYAKRMAYEEYANRLFHLFQQREEVLEALKEFIILLDKDQLELRSILINVALAAIEAIIEKLESQIPVPKGAQEHIQGTIMSRRKANLRKEVLDPVQDYLLGKILEIQTIPQDREGTKKMAQVLRQPHTILSSRGETYFEEMEERVQEQLAAMGDQTLSGELKYVTDTPQVLVKQYGKEVFRWTESSGLDIASLSPAELYAGILALKSAELMFGDATTTIERKHEIAKSLFEDYFLGQSQSVKNVTALIRALDETQEQSEPSEPLSSTKPSEESQEAGSQPDADLTASEPTEEKPEVIEEPSPSTEPEEDSDEAGSQPDADLTASEPTEEKSEVIGEPSPFTELGEKSDEDSSPPDSELPASERSEGSIGVIDEPIPSTELSEESDESSSPPESETLDPESSKEKIKDIPTESEDIGES